MNVGQSMQQIKESSKSIDIKSIFPYQWDESGRCEKLGEDNRCTVYNDRPFICGIDNLLKYSGMTKEEYYRKTIDRCNQLIDHFEINPKFKIK